MKHFPQINCGVLNKHSIHTHTQTHRHIHTNAQQICVGNKFIYNSCEPIPRRDSWPYITMVPPFIPCPTLICIFMKPNTIPPPPPASAPALPFGQWKIWIWIQIWIFIYFTQGRQGGEEGAGTATASCGRGANCRVEWTGVEHVLCLGRGLMTSLDAGYQTEARHNPRAAARSLIWHTECSGEHREGGGEGTAMRSLTFLYIVHFPCAIFLAIYPNGKSRPGWRRGAIRFRPWTWPSVIGGWIMSLARAPVPVGAGAGAAAGAARAAARCKD